MNFGEQITNLSTFSLEDAGNVATYAKMAVPELVVTTVAGIHYFNKNRAEAVGVGGGSSDILIKAAAVREGRVWSQCKRFGGFMCMAMGASLVIANGLKPTIEIEDTAEGVGIVVVDESYSMEYTSDMDGDTTRLDNVAAALPVFAAGLPEDYRLGVVTYGVNNELTQELTTDRTKISSSLNYQVEDPNTGELTNVIDANGAQIGPAIETAQNVLEGIGGDTKKQMFIITDGTVDKFITSPDGTKLPFDMPATVSELREKGIDVQIIITGTADGTYTTSEYDPQPFPAGATTEIFSGIAGMKISQATDADTISKSLTSSVAEATDNDMRIRSSIFNYVAVLFTAFGAGWSMLRAYKGKI